MSQDDRRVGWVREKVCSALGISEDQFNQLGSAGGDECTVDDLVSLMDCDKTAGCIFYCLAELQEVEEGVVFVLLVINAQKCLLRKT